MTARSSATFAARMTKPYTPSCAVGASRSSGPENVSAAALMDSGDAVTANSPIHHSTPAGSPGKSTPSSLRTVLRPPSQPTRYRDRSDVPSASSAVTPWPSWLSPTSSQPRRMSAPTSTACSVSSRSLTGCGMPRMYGWTVSSRSGNGLGMPAKAPVSGYRVPFARNRSSRPRWSITSMLRTCSPRARTCLVGSVSRSSTTTRAPCSRNSPASIMPVGPPPATITSITKTPRFGSGR